MQSMNSSQSKGPKGKVRGFFSFFFFHLITLGVYNVFWWFKVANEVNTFLGEQRMSAAKVIFLSPLTLGLYALVWQFSTGPKIIKDVQQRAGLLPKAPFFVSPWSFQSSLNKVWNALPA
ncbi:MAG: DUF4234 domain-containing protein [Deltaproteobacteria bacterium]|nr:DUF4234 domain-containing protein [Deltaproteobacteria bacterium]